MNIFLFDMGLPMIVPAMYLMIPALIPVVLIEAYSLRKSLNLPFRTAVSSAIAANIISTIVGVPVTWFLLAFFQLVTGGGSAFGIDTLWKKILAVTWQAPWLIPYEKEGYWIGFAAMLFLLIPFFFASWILEYWVSRRQLALGLYRLHEPNFETAEPNPVMKKLLLEGYWPEICRSWRNANLFSYGLLALFLVVMLLATLLRGR